MSVLSTRSCRAFGLTVATEIELPELPEAEDSSVREADVAVEWGTVEQPTGVDPDTTYHYESSEQYKLRYPVADVLVEGGERIVVDTAEDASSEILRHLVLGPAFNYLLHQRNVFVLHASVVSVDGDAVAFVGDSGQGKTTTAASFLRDGLRVLSDDVAAITFEPDGPAVRSGYPCIKLDPAVPERFDQPVEEVAPTSPDRDRHFYRLQSEQPSEPVPLDRVYLLEDGPEVDITPLAPREQLMALVTNTYVAPILDGDGEASANFDQCAAIADATEVRQLRRPYELDALPEVVDAVRTDSR
jgi:hypothetical protein